MGNPGTRADKPVAKLSPVTTGASLRELQPKSVGMVLRPFPSCEDDMPGETLAAACSESLAKPGPCLNFPP
jgi:hypothetical protein